ncbi:MAG: 1,4-dihydroxy-2-naphthoate octaprenyltransferase [Sphingomonadales bacterium]|nr:1,4-dihydroxy-2-naphthoate octaprenyltransferase [Sphingomonadales bacterium]
MKSWIQAFRLKTLPLAVSGIALGAALAGMHGKFSSIVFLLASLTAVSLQILSNLANDYGDFMKGTDKAANRTDRALTSGSIAPQQMKTALMVNGLVALVLGLLLLYIYLPNLQSFGIFLALGILGILAALGYTLGKRAFGYSGLGDVVVFIFFGPVAVCGTFYLMAGILMPQIWLAAMGMGLLSAAVLNVNNMRDTETDNLSGKLTLALRMGKRLSLMYHKALVLLGFIFVFASFLSEGGSLQIRPNLTEPMLLLLVYAPVILLLTRHTNRVSELNNQIAPTTPEARAPWNAELKNLSLTILLLVTMYALTVWLFVG